MEILIPLMVFIVVGFYVGCLIHSLFTGRLLWFIVMLIVAPACALYLFAPAQR